MFDIFGVEVSVHDLVLGAGVFVGGVITTLGKRRAARDTADGATPDAEVVLPETVLLRQILEEIRTFAADVRKWRVDDRERGQDAYIRVLEDRFGMLRQGQGTTHGRQAEILDELASLRGLLLEPGVADEVHRHHEKRGTREGGEQQER